MKNQSFLLVLSLLVALSLAGCGSKAKQLGISADKKVISGDYAGAVADYDQAIKISSGASEFYFKRGFVKKFGLKNDADGCRDMQKAIDLGYNKTVREVVDNSCKK
jgi:hypothetical protein